MRPRPASIAITVALLLLGACSSGSHHKTPPSTTATTPTSTSTTTSTSSTTSTTTTTQPVVTTTSSPPTTPTAPGPRIVSFTGPPSPVQCFATNSSVQLQWETQHATKVTLQINGGAVFATYGNGRHSALEPFTCNGTTQTYLLTAHGANGTTATRTLKLAERVST